MKKEKIILDTDCDIVEYKYNIEGWVGKDGRFYGKNEQLARKCNSTHKKCECGEVIRNFYEKCKTCSRKQNYEKYKNLDYIPYTGDPVFSYDSGSYFYDEDSLLDYLEENDLTEIDLYPSMPQNYTNIDYDIWAEVFPEDTDDIPKELMYLVDTFNRELDQLGPASYTQNTSKRTSYKKV